MAFLTSLDGPLAGTRFALDTPCLVGRGPYNHVVLDDARISRQHAKISPEAGGHVVYDLNSANGTFVNDVGVARRELSPGDVVRFGPFVFRFDEADTVKPSSRPMRAVRRVEELTRRGFEAPTTIVDSLDAVGVTTGARPSGLLELEDAQRKLRTLYEFMHTVATTLDEEELLDRLLRHVLDVFSQAETAAVYFYDPETSLMEGRKVLQKDGRLSQGLSLPKDIQHTVVQEGRAILSAPLTLSADEQAPKAAAMMMHAPMIHRNVAHGVLNVRANPRDAAFTQGDLDLFTAIAAQAAMALQNVYMHRESLKQERLRQDLVLAEHIQKSFLPSRLPEVPGLEFVSEYRPAFSVGGDFYDVFWIAEERLSVVIGDVSGKGVAAALLMAKVSSDLRAAMLAEHDPVRALGQVNRLILERAQTDIFVTALCLTIDLRTSAVTFASAGHLPPYVRHRASGELAKLEDASGTPLGLLEDAIYENAEVTLAAGDILVLYTDGVVEATDIQGRQFGFEGLERSLRHAPPRAAGIHHRLLSDLQAHVGDASQYDDLTLLSCGIQLTKT